MLVLSMMTYEKRERVRREQLPDHQMELRETLKSEKNPNFEF
jgi:hypothetical protein